MNQPLHNLLEYGVIGRNVSWVLRHDQLQEGFKDYKWDDQLHFRSAM